MIWTVPRIWEGGDVWIIGGGPSMPKQFGIPDKVIQNVVSGTSPPSVYSPYMKFLHDKHVIGVNIAYKIGDWMDMVFFGDGGFFLEHIQEISRFPGLRVSCNPTTESHPWVKTLARDLRHNKGITVNPRAVSWNHNSGAAAISVAAHAGASRIFLLGFDMCKINGDQHWHDLYGKKNSNKPKKEMHLPFDRHLMGFPYIAKDAAKMGIEIINVCPESAIKEFRKVSLKEVIRETRLQSIQEQSVY